MVADAAAGLAKFRDNTVVNRTTINQYLVHLKMLEMRLLLISATLLPEAEWLLYIHPVGWSASPDILPPWTFHEGQ